VRGKVLTKAQLGSVPQVGESRVRKYADRILAVMNRECQGGGSEGSGTGEDADAVLAEEKAT
jgi:hypothetical protein